MAVDTLAPVDPQAPRVSALEPIAHLLGGLGIGSVLTVLLILMSPALNYTLPVAGFDLGSVVPELVVLGSLGLALMAPLRPFAWLLAAVGLFGLAALYAQGDRLDATSLLVLAVLVMSLQFGGLLLAAGRASGRARWSMALGFAVGVTAGHDGVLLLVRAFWAGSVGNADAFALACVGIMLTVAGVLALVAGRGGPRSPQPPVPWWLLVAVAVAGVLAVALTRVWEAILSDRIESFVGGISESDAEFWVSFDRLARFAIAAAVAGLLVGMALRRLPRGTARWVLVAFGLAVAVGAVRAGQDASPLWWAMLLAATGAVAGIVVVRRADGLLPWDAIGLALTAGLLFADAPALDALGWFGVGLAAAAGLARLAGAEDGEAVWQATALGIAALILGFQVLLPAMSRIGGPGDSQVGVVGAAALALAAAVCVAIFLVRRQRADAR
jgi:hypothetical protein